MQEEPNTLLFLQEDRQHLLLSFNSLLFLLEATRQEKKNSDMWQVCPGKRLPVSTHLQAHLHPETCMTKCWDVTSKLFLQNCFFTWFFSLMWAEVKLCRKLRGWRSIYDDVTPHSTPSSLRNCWNHPSGSGTMVRGSNTSTVAMATLNLHCRPGWYTDLAAELTEG